MKLLLTSAGFKNPKVGKKFLEVVGEPAHETKIIFIPTAATTELIIGNNKEIIE